LPQRLDPKLNVLPAAQQKIWPSLAPAFGLNFVLYGGTAIALHLGHRESLDFDFFKSDPLDKDRIREALGFIQEAAVLQDAPDTLAILAQTPLGPVKISFFGNIRIGRVNDPLQTADGVMLVASLDDLMATKVKAVLDRAEAKDYRDIAAMLSRGVSLPAGLGAFKKMFGGEPAQVLRALGYFVDGDLPTLAAIEKEILRNARDGVTQLPNVTISPGLTGH
jgi:hypothetical protein